MLLLHLDEVSNNAIIMVTNVTTDTVHIKEDESFTLRTLRYLSLKERHACERLSCANDCTFDSGEFLFQMRNVFI